MGALSVLLSSLPGIITAALLVLATILILIFTGTTVKIGKFVFAPGKKTNHKITHVDCPLYNEHLYMLQEAFDDGIRYKEIEMPIYRRLRKIIAYKANLISIEYMFDAFHVVFHDLKGKDVNLSDSPDFQKIMLVITRLKEHTMAYTWSIVEDNHIIEKIEKGTWQSYRNSRIQESLNNVIAHMLNKTPKLVDVTDLDAVKDWYERNAHKFVTASIDLWEVDVIPLLQELHTSQNVIKEKYFKKI